jgi:hypothetical protein
MRVLLATLLSEQITDARASADEARESWDSHGAVQHQEEGGSGSGSGGYSGPRCYDPGGVTWHPC